MLLISMKWALEMQRTGLGHIKNKYCDTGCVAFQHHYNYNKIISDILITSQELNRHTGQMATALAETLISITAVLWTALIYTVHPL